MQGCAFGGGRLEGCFKSSCNSEYQRLESGFSSRAGSCEAVGAQ